MKQKKYVSFLIFLEPDLLSNIDTIRGLIPRATYLREKIIKPYIENKED